MIPAYIRFNIAINEYKEKQTEYKQLISQNEYLCNHLHQLKIENSALLNKNEEIQYDKPHIVKADLLKKWPDGPEDDSFLIWEVQALESKVSCLKKEIEIITNENNDLSKKCAEIVKQNARIVSSTQEREL